MTFKLAVLRNWTLGQTTRVRSDSEVIQWLLDAHWYNWSPRHRGEITRDVEANQYVWITPTRLGAVLNFPLVVDSRKQWANCFVQLFDHRVMTVDCFCLQTYAQIFARFFRKL